MTIELKATRPERSGGHDAGEAAAASSYASSLSSSSAAAAAAAAADELAPISPPRAVGGREFRSPQVLSVLLTEAGAAAARAAPLVAHAVECEEEEESDDEEETDQDGSATSADGPSSSLPLLPATSSPLTQGRPSCFLVVHNVSKKHNVGALARAATAFGVSEVRDGKGRERAGQRKNQAAWRNPRLLSHSLTLSTLLSHSFLSRPPPPLSRTEQTPQVLLVGNKQYHAFGSHGSAAYVFFRHFPKLCAARKWLNEEKNAKLLGVEIDEGAVSVCSPGVFEGNTAFLMGNEVDEFWLGGSSRDREKKREKEERKRE